MDQEDEPLNPPAKSANRGRPSYFAASPTVSSSPQDVTLKLPDMTFELRSDRGVFSNTGIDAGTQVLLEVAPPPPVPGDLLDLGCGYGPIAVTLAFRYPERAVWAVDVNERAINLVRDNAARLDRLNLHAGKAEELPDGLRFAAIYSNPPIRVGKGVMRDLLLVWLDRLLPEGRAYWVVKKNLGADSLGDWLTEQGYPTTRLRSRRGYRVLESQPRNSAE